MGWREELNIGAGGSLMGAVKKNNRQKGLLEMLMGGGGEQYDSPIGPTPNGGAPIPSDMIDPQMQQNDRDSAIAKLGALGDFGAGLSAAGGYSTTPVSFGQALAAGNQSMQAGQDREFENQFKRAKLEGLGAKEFDLEKQAQQIMIKKQMGIALNPQEQAIGSAYDSIYGAKNQTVTTPDGRIVQVPSQRPIFGQPQANRGGGQMQRPPLSSFMR